MAEPMEENRQGSEILFEVLDGGACPEQSQSDPAAIIRRVDLMAGRLVITPDGDVVPARRPRTREEMRAIIQELPAESNNLRYLVTEASDYFLKRRPLATTLAVGLIISWFSRRK